VSAPESWTEKREHGSFLAVRVGIWIYRTFGFAARSFALWPCALYFALAHGETRRASREWLATLWSLPAGRAALERRPGLLASIRHVHAFAENVLDRVGLWAGEDERFEFEHQGGEALLALAAEKRGAILFGAHLGSFDMLRLIARRYDLVVNVLMYTDNAERLNALFDAFGGGSRVRVIRLDPDSVQTAFDMKACLARGEFVGVVVDRARVGGRMRVAESQFMGRRAAFPLSPFQLGAVLGAPMFLSVCYAVGRRRYFAVSEPVYAGGPVPRAQRDALARRALEAYVRRLEAYCLRAPLQWFNFYDFWGESEKALASQPR
jgi:predicted LPLAT superfamily acyltransferase